MPHRNNRSTVRSTSLFRLFLHVHGLQVLDSIRRIKRSGTESNYDLENVLSNVPVFADNGNLHPNLWNRSAEFAVPKRAPI